MKDSVKVLVCCHKKDIICDESPYLPIQVGASLSLEDLGIQRDDTGDNISFKNDSFCELTGMYWAWKNLKDVDVIGLSHYRRYFDFHNQTKKIVPYTTFPVSSFNSMDLTIPQSVIDDCRNGVVYLARPHNFRYNLMLEYSLSHYSDDFRALRQVIKDTQTSDIQESFFQVFYQHNHLSPCNMFIMNWDDFDAYCSWLFPIINELERRIDITHYSSSQKRIYGYIAERLLNVWVFAKKKKIKLRPVLFFSDSNDIISLYSPLSYAIRSFINDVAALLLRHRNHNF